MQEQYMCTATGTKNGQAYATLARLVQGTKRDSTDRYSFLDSNRTVREQEEIPVGTIVTYNTTRAATPAATGGFPDTPVASAPRTPAKS